MKKCVLKKIGVIANCDKPDTPQVLKKLYDLSVRRGLKLFLEPAAGKILGEGDILSTKQMVKRVNAIISIGGDGTVLRVAREIGTCNIPVLGINTGGLGFLTSISEKDIVISLDNLVAGKYLLSRRSVIDVFHRSKKSKKKQSFRALNEAVIGRQSASRILNFEVWINNIPVTSYRCDGIIVSTPTGSTGHSLSAGGPILLPETSVLLLSLICPHTLSWRPLVIPDKDEILIKAMTNAPQRLTIDGQVGCVVSEGDEISLKRSKYSVSFIQMEGYSYFDVLRQKLQWSISHIHI